MSKASAEAFVQKIMEDEDLSDRTAQTKPEDVLPIAKEMGYEFTAEELTDVMNSRQELAPEELEGMAGGDRKAREGAKNKRDSAHRKWLKLTYCHGDAKGPKHDFVCIAHYEEPILFNWTKGHYFYQCKRCGFMHDKYK